MSILLDLVEVMCVRIQLTDDGTSADLIHVAVPQWGKPCGCFCGHPAPVWDFRQSELAVHAVYCADDSPSI